MATKQPVAKRMYGHKDGTEGRHAQPNTVGMRFEFVGGKSLEIGLDDIHKDVRNACLWHGINQKVGDAFAGAKGDAGEAYESALSIVERLKEGTWVATREGAGPSTGLLVEAIVRAKIANGEKADAFTDERKAEIAGKLKGATPAETQTKRAGALANPAIKAAFEALKAERAAAKAKSAADAAKGQEANLETF